MPPARERAQTVPQRGPLPGEPGTIPERIQPRDPTSPQEMVISAEEIKRAQEALKSRGYDPGAISGRMHAKTQDALREFQKNNNLAPTGVLDKKTADRLDVLVPDQSGSADPERPR
jgi:peptidoglycan hydrolase-like protein with peptidoglycan-binding domain